MAYRNIKIEKLFWITESGHSVYNLLAIYFRAFAETVHHGGEGTVLREAKNSRSRGMPVINRLAVTNL